MRTQDIEYKADGATMIGQYVVDDTRSGRRPGVLVIHEGLGLAEHTKNIAARLAGLGYAAFAMDYYGGGKPIANLADARSRIAVWIADPTGSRARALAALDVLKAQKEVDATKLAAIGYGFGDRIERLHQIFANAEHVLVIALVVVTAVSWIVVVSRVRRRP